MVQLREKGTAFARDIAQAMGICRFDYDGPASVEVFSKPGWSGAVNVSVESEDGLARSARLSFDGDAEYVLHVRIVPSDQEPHDDPYYEIGDDTMVLSPQGDITVISRDWDVAHQCLSQPIIEVSAPSTNEQEADKDRAWVCEVAENVMRMLHKKGISLDV